MNQFNRHSQATGRKIAPSNDAGRHPANCLVSTTIPLKSGFTVIELLVTISIILFLLSVFAVTIGNTLLTARERATQATLLKIDGLLQQRIESFHRAVDRALEQGTNNQRYFRQAKAELGIANIDTTNYIPAMKVVARKMLFKQNFPQSFSEIPSNHPLLTDSNYVPGNHKPETESAALLYYTLTKASVFGAPPVSSENFSSSEAKDTDGDGLLEFVDAWGNPIRYYRWPTALVRNTTSGTTITPAVANSSLTYNAGTLDRQYAQVLFTNLPAPIGTNLDPLGVDPDDGYGRIQSMLVGLGQSDVAFRNRYHQLDTFFAPLLLSGGPGGVIGLDEPNTANGRLALPVSRDDLLDDISNYNSRR